MSKAARNVACPSILAVAYLDREVFQCRAFAQKNERLFVKINFASICLVCAMLLGCGENPDAWPTAAFDKDRWAKTEEEERFVFARDLVSTRRLEGMNRQEVVDLLGPPSYSDGKVDYVTYILKVSSGSLYLLEVRFKADERGSVVEKVLVRTD